MAKIIEAIYEDGVFKPLEKVELKNGEKVKLRLEKRELSFRPIDLGEEIKVDEIKRLREEVWTSF
ncbi:MAG: antitoxin family protein [Archaeoglobaceae archaeon]